MNRYECYLKRGNRVVYQCNTMANSEEKAKSNTWFKYARDERIPDSRVPYFLSSIKKELTCTCAEVKPDPEIPKEAPKEEPKRVQLNLFGDKLDGVLGIDHRVQP